MARLTALRGSAHAGRLPPDLLESVVRALDNVLANARRVRGDARDAVLDQLAALDARLLAAAAAALDPATSSGLAAEVDRELAPFKPRMTQDALATATRAATERLVRDHFALPKLAY